MAQVVQIVRRDVELVEGREYRAKVALALDLLRDRNHRCDGMAFRLPDNVWDLTIDRVSSPREQTNPRSRNDGPGDGFLWTLHNDNTYEELCGGGGDEYPSPERAWDAALDALAQRLVSPLRLAI